MDVDRRATEAIRLAQEEEIQRLREALSNLPQNHSYHSHNNLVEIYENNSNSIESQFITRAGNGEEVQNHSSWGVFGIFNYLFVPKSNIKSAAITKV